MRGCSRDKKATALHTPLCVLLSLPDYSMHSLERKHPQGRPVQEDCIVLLWLVMCLVAGDACNLCPAIHTYATLPPDFALHFPDWCYRSWSPTARLSVPTVLLFMSTRCLSLLHKRSYRAEEQTLILVYHLHPTPFHQTVSHGKQYVHLSPRPGTLPLQEVDSLLAEQSRILPHHIQDVKDLKPFLDCICKLSG